MTLFWILSAAMIIAALALLAPTLLRRHRSAEDDTQGLNVEIARDRLAELTKAKDAGDLSDEEFEQGKQDLQLALAQDLEASDTPAPKAGSNGRGALIASALMIPLITVPIYFEIGSPQLITNPPGTPTAATGHGADSLPPLDQLAEQLRLRMEEDPDNAEGWFLLGRTYMRLEDYAGATRAFEQVVRLMPEQTVGLLSLADAMIMRDGMRTDSTALALLEKALRIEPDNVTALWLLGNAAYDNGAVTSALDYWQQAYPLLAQAPEMQGQLAQRILEAGGELPASPPNVADLPPIMPTADASPGPAPAPAADATTGGIRVQVALAPSLIERAGAADTVFVLARAEQGPPMPLAVARHRVDELPLDIRLTDAMAMMPAMKLSSFDRVEVVAKVSKSGRAGTQPGDLLAPGQVVDTGAPPESVQLLIDQVAE
jgi:cytochrome c-type biogenesis protein CcmH